MSVSRRSLAVTAFANDSIQPKRNSCPQSYWASDLPCRVSIFKPPSIVVSVGVATISGRFMPPSTVVEIGGLPDGRSTLSVEIQNSSDATFIRSCKAKTSLSGNKSEWEKLSEGKGDKTMITEEVTSRGGEIQKRWKPSKNTKNDNWCKIAANPIGYSVLSNYLDLGVFHFDFGTRKFKQNHKKKILKFT